VLAAVGLLTRSGHAPEKKDLAKLPLQPLPESLIRRRKTGFTVPIRELLHGIVRLEGRHPGRAWAQEVYRHYARGARPGEPRGTGSTQMEPAPLPPRDAILIFRIGQLGDTLVALPAIKAIRNRYSRHRLVLLTNERPHHPNKLSSWEVLGPTGWFDDVIFYEPTRSLWKIIRNALEVSRKVRGLSPVHVYNLSPERTFYQALRDRLFSLNYRGTTDILPTDRGMVPGSGGTDDCPRHSGMAAALQIAGVSDAVEQPFELPLSEIVLNKAESMLKERRVGGTGTCLIAFGPGSKMPAKRWPIDRYVEVARKVLEGNRNAEIIVLGDRDDRVAGRLITDSLPERVHNFAGISPCMSPQRC